VLRLNKIIQSLKRQ